MGSGRYTPTQQIWDLGLPCDGEGTDAPGAAGTRIPRRCYCNDDGLIKTNTKNASPRSRSHFRSPLLANSPGFPWAGPHCQRQCNGWYGLSHGTHDE